MFRIHALKSFVCKRADLEFDLRFERKTVQIHANGVLR